MLKTAPSGKFGCSLSKGGLLILRIFKGYRLCRRPQSVVTGEWDSCRTCECGCVFVCVCDCMRVVRGAFSCAGVRACVCMCVCVRASRWLLRFARTSIYPFAEHCSQGCLGCRQRCRSFNVMFDGLRAKCCRLFCLMASGADAAQFPV